MQLALVIYLLVAGYLAINNWDWLVQRSQWLPIVAMALFVLLRVTPAQASGL